MEGTPDLEKALHTIDISVKYNLALALCQAAIPIWENYAKDPENLSYMDGVGGSYYISYQDSSGNSQLLEKDIAARSVQIIKLEQDKPGSQAAVMEELAWKLKAHIDAVDIWDDWQPQEMEFTLYALHNFIQLYQGKFKEKEESTLHHIIKLAGEALVIAKIKTLDELLSLLNNQKQPEKPDQPTKS
jgi:hypothetical protein